MDTNTTPRHSVWKRRFVAHAMDFAIFVILPLFFWVFCPFLDWERPGAVEGKRLALVAVNLPLAFGAVEVLARCRLSKRLVNLRVLEGAGEPSLKACVCRVLAKWGWLVLWSVTLSVTQIAGLDRILANDPRGTACATWALVCVVITGTWLILDGLVYLADGVALHDKLAGTSVVVQTEHRTSGFDVVRRQS